MRRFSTLGTVYLVLAVATFSLIGGIALGSFTFGNFSNIPRQSSVSGLAPGAPPGLSYPLAEDELVSPSTTPATGNCTATNLGTDLSPTHLINGQLTPICLSASVSGYSTGDSMWIIEVSWNSSAVPSMLFNVTVFEQTTPTANDILATAWVETSATITTAETAVLAVDLTQSGDSSVDGFTVLVTQV